MDANQPAQFPAPDGRVALVTGSGAPRVGRAVALRLAQAGYDIAIHANRSVGEAEQVAERISEHGHRVVVYQASLEDADQAQQLVSRVVKDFGRLDVLVNSAAIWFPTRLEEITAELLSQYYKVNSVATFLIARAAGLQMVQQSTGGSIINIGDWALVRPYLDHAAYFPSKAAVVAMTQSLAVELAERNRQVRVNCIHPGPVLLTDEMPAEKREAVTASTLLKRVGTPEHIAHAVQFLVENDFVTGICLPVDGGRTIYADERLQTEFRTG